MAIHIQRREFIVAICGVAAAWPLVVHAQQPAMPTIGYLSSGGQQSEGFRLAAFAGGLNELGYREGQNVRITYRWAENQYDRLPGLATDLVSQKVALIFASGGNISALAAKAATSIIPIVFMGGGDPVKLGLVAALNRPGGNVTGVNNFSNVLVAKRLGLLQDLMPTTVIAFLVNPDNPNAGPDAKDVEEAARQHNLKTLILHAHNEGDLDKAFASLVMQGVRVLVVAADPFFINHRDRITEIAARSAVLAIYNQREFVEAGGLMSYGTSLPDAYHQAGIYTGRVLKGEKPSDLPVLQPTKFELVINLKTALTLGLTIPPGVLAIADEVIE